MYGIPRLYKRSLTLNKLLYKEEDVRKMHQQKIANFFRFPNHVYHSIKRLFKPKSKLNLSSKQSK